MERADVAIIGGGLVGCATAWQLARKGASVVLVSHERDSLFRIADDGIFLDAESRRPLAQGRPADMQHDATLPLAVRNFLQRKDEQA